MTQGPTDDVLARLAGQLGERAIRVATAITGDRAEAEDCVQEALARSWQHRQELPDEARARGFAMRVVVNLALRARRRRRVRRALDRLVALAVATRVPREATPPDEWLVDHERRAQLLGSLERLSAMQRTAIALRYGGELSVSEVAAVLGIGEASVKTHLVRGLERLRELIGARP
jgi:RNA polymerase sigma-70 factor (ECF subfamily)